jgi:DNA-binding NarL/FixJ family response regulator
MTGSTVMVLGVDATGRICAASPEFLDLTGFETGAVYGHSFRDVATQLDDARVRVALADGSARDFQTSSCPLDAGDAAISNVIVLTPLDDAAAKATALGISLSEREGQILGFVTEGYRVATIARELYISPSTVRNHLSAIFKKLGVANQAQLLERLKQA